MTGTSAQIAQQIDRVLSKTSASVPESDVEALFASLSEVLKEPVSQDLRDAGNTLAQIRRTDGEAFECALVALRKAVASQEAKDASATQFANDPELMEEFLVEAREHLASVETGVLKLEQQPDNAEMLNAVFRSFHNIKGLAGFMGATAIHKIAHDIEDVLDLARSGKLRLSAGIIDLILKSADELNHCLDQACSRAEVGSGFRSSAGQTSVRVDIAKLNHLIETAAKLVLAESTVRNDLATAVGTDPLLSANLTRLSEVVQEVRETSMSMRLVSFDGLFQRMTRLTRDLARKLGKNIELVTTGHDVEVDPGVAEALADPMLHMIRNSVDHGIESPAERVIAGKSERGAVRVKAMRDAGDLVLEISDDGRGMNPEKILAEARQLGLVGEQQHPDTESTFRLVLEAGLSTVYQVTELSGRGVGMDVVSKQVEKLGGRINIHSTAGKGCTFVLRLPSKHTHPFLEAVN